VKLVSGRNHLSSDEYKAIALHPDYKKYINWGAIEEIKENKEKEPTVDDPDSLAGYPVEEAEKLVKGVNDLEQLKKWQSNESRARNRKTVLNAIATQIADVEQGKL
jgi:hypothetical protein